MQRIEECLSELCKCKKNLHVSIMQVGKGKALAEEWEKMTLACVSKITSIHSLSFQKMLVISLCR